MIYRSLRQLSIAAIVLICTACGADPLQSPALSNNSNCLQGTWHADASAMTALMQSNLTTIRPTVITGGMTFTFGSDNSFTQTVDPTTVKVVTPGSDAMTMEMSYHGTIHGTYTNNGSNYTFSNLTGDGVQIDNILLNGQPFTQSAIPIDNNSMLLNSSSVLTTACAGNILTLNWLINDKTVTLTLHR